MINRKISVEEVLAYFSTKTEYMTVIRLNKLLFYTKVYLLLWDEIELTDTFIFVKDDIGVKGSISNFLKNNHKDVYKLKLTMYNTQHQMTDDVKKTLDVVFDEYGKYSLSQLNKINIDELHEIGVLYNSVIDEESFYWFYFYQQEGEFL